MELTLLVPETTCRSENKDIPQQYSDADSTEETVSRSTITLNENRHIYVQHECQMSENGEVNLHENFDNCTKKAGHSNFIPFNKFNMEHLPEGHRDNDLYQFIKTTGGLTVGICVTMVSSNRPMFWPNTTDSYPFGNDKGNESLRLGSGEVSVFKFIDGRGYNSFGSRYDNFGYKFNREYRNCPCEKCQQSNKPNNVWWEIFVRTAAHVVFDEIEASHTTCRLFFDEQDSPKVLIDKFSLHYVNVGDDFCVLKYVTCEPLGNKLYTMDEHSCTFWKKLKNYRLNKSSDKLTFIVSHPHGCSKQVSVGQWIDNNKVTEYNKDYDMTKLTYTTSTCPGSSGARIYCVGYSVGHVHWGTMDSVINCSGVGGYKK